MYFDLFLLFPFSIATMTKDISKLAGFVAMI